MYILDKNKDYYDHFSKIYGEDKSITFDRRGSVFITDELLINKYEATGRGKNEQFILLETGTVQYLIRIYDIVLITDYKTKTYDKYISSKMEVVQVFKDKNKFGCSVSIQMVRNSWFSFFNAKNENRDYSNYEVQKSKEIKLPILANTQITKLIPPEEIWKELSNYISSLKNDKDSVYVPDTQKIVNHGFDKRESFRNIK